MSQPEAVQKLVEAHRANVERRVVAGMFEGVFKASPLIESFSAWQLVVSGAIASFLLANSAQMTSALTKSGFMVCSGFLVVSAIMGFYSKSQAVLFRVCAEGRSAVLQELEKINEASKPVESEIHALAKSTGHEVCTQPRMEVVIREFLVPMPWWVRWRVNKTIAKDKDSQHFSYLGQLACLNAQGISAYLQTVGLLGFFGSALVYAGSSI